MVPVILYQEDTPTRARVTTVLHQPDKVDPAVVAQGIALESAWEEPAPSDYYNYTAWVNPQTKDVWWESELKDISVLAFKRLLTTQERIAIRQAAQADPVIEDFLDILDSAVDVRLDDPDMIAGVGYMVSQGIFTAARGDEILAGGV